MEWFATLHKLHLTFGNIVFTASVSRIATSVVTGGCDSNGDFHMKALSVFVLAALSVAGVAQAQTGSGQQMTNQPTQAQAPMPRAAPDGSFTDECGFRYNSRGDRIDARGRIFATSSVLAERRKLPSSLKRLCRQQACQPC